MQIEVRGEGPPLVLLHGWAMHAGVFAPLVARLVPHYQLHLIDLPGHGHSIGSTTPLALAPVIDLLVQRVPRAAWLGWSLGGLFALHAAATRPQHVSGLVMLCASPRFVRGEPASGDRWPDGMPAEVFRDFAAGLRSDYRATLDRFLALEASGSDAALTELRTLRAALFARGEPSAGVLADGLDLLQTTDLRPVLPRLSMPSLWLSGRRDRLVDPRAMAAAATLAPEARHVRIERAGHAPFLTRADDVAGHVAAFMDTVPASLPAASAR